jgi:hypothetical protein
MARRKKDRKGKALKKGASRQIVSLNPDDAVRTLEAHIELAVSGTKNEARKVEALLKRQEAAPFIPEGGLVRKRVRQKRSKKPPPSMPAPRPDHLIQIEQRVTRLEATSTDLLLQMNDFVQAAIETVEEEERKANEDLKKGPG